MHESLVLYFKAYDFIQISSFKMCLGVFIQKQSI